MMEWFSMGAQFVTLLALGWIIASVWYTTKMTRQMSKLIGQYRREIEWLTARIEALEGKANGRRERV